MRISVLMPVYNAEAYIRETLSSIRVQTFPIHEIIVFNDGSTDGSGGILSAMKDIRFIDSPHVGVAKARNRLVREASGDWIAFIDADDFWEADKLEKQAGYIKAHPECDIVCCATETFLDASVTEPTRRQEELADTKFPYLLQSSLIRRSLFDRFEFNEVYSHGGEDTDWFMRVSGSGIRLDKIPDIGCHYRIHGSNMSLEADMRKSTYLRMIAAAARKRKQAVPDLSVIIPAYNAEKYLADAIESVRRQSLPEGFSRVEIVVVDDGSTDNTAAVAENLPQVRCIRGNHRYAAAARNTGIRAAQGRFLLFLDADDLLTDGALEALWKPFSDEKTMASFGMASDFVSEELDASDVAGIKVKADPYRGFFSGCVLIRNSVFKEDCMFDESLKTGETVEWGLRFRAKQFPYAEVDAVTVRRRIHLDNTGRKYGQEERMSYAAILRQRLKGKR